MHRSALLALSIGQLVYDDENNIDDDDDDDSNNQGRI